MFILHTVWLTAWIWMWKTPVCIYSIHIWTCGDAACKCCNEINISAVNQAAVHCFQVPLPHLSLRCAEVFFILIKTSQICSSRMKCRRLLSVTQRFVCKSDRYLCNQPAVCRIRFGLVWFGLLRQLVENWRQQKRQLFHLGFTRQKAAEAAAVFFIFDFLLNCPAGLCIVFHLRSEMEREQRRGMDEKWKNHLRVPSSIWHAWMGRERRECVGGWAAEEKKRRKRRMKGGGGRWGRFF